MTELFMTIGYEHLCVMLSSQRKACVVSWCKGGGLHQDGIHCRWEIER